MITLQNIYLSFGESEVLKDINFSINRGEIKVILGASGSGKSTILKVILGLYKPHAGRVIIDDDDVTEFTEEMLCNVRHKMGMVFQSNALFDSMTVGENVGYRLKEQSMDEAETEERVRESLSFVGLEHTIDMMPAELSGGMKKRVAIARAIAPSPKIILYDEPTTGLDPFNTVNVCKLILALREKKKMGSIVVTHDLHSAFMLADKVAMIYEGEIIFEGTSDEFKGSADDRVKSFFKPSEFECNTIAI